MKDLSKLEKIGEGGQGIVFRAEWQGHTVIYKQMKLTKGDERKDFEREFSVWQYVSFYSSLLFFFYYFLFWY